MLPAPVIPWIAIVLPGIELLVGIAMVVGFASRAATLIVIGMLFGFTLGLAQALMRGIDLRCGCFGGTDFATWGTVARDVAMLGAAVFVWFSKGGRLRLGPIARSRVFL